MFLSNALPSYLQPSLYQVHLGPVPLTANSPTWKGNAGDNHNQQALAPALCGAMRGAAIVNESEQSSWPARIAVKSEDGSNILPAPKDTIHIVPPRRSAVATTARRLG
jgi:hypothetical protein